MSTEPVYPFSLSARYRLVCPKGSSGVCPGWINYKTARGLVVVAYCHDRVCPELFDQMLRCPCKDSAQCEGNYWNEKEEHICRRKEKIQHAGL